MLVKKHFVACLFISALVAGCAAPAPRLQTASGNPEIVIANASKKQVIEKIVAAKLEKGMQVKSVTDYGVVVAKKVDGSFMASFLYGSNYDSTPEARIHYNVVQSGPNVRVFSTAEMVTNPGSAFERTSDVTLSLATKMQAELEELKASFESDTSTPINNPNLQPAATQPTAAQPPATRPATMQPAATSPAQVAVPVPASSTPQEQDLRELKKLYDAGLISKEIYFERQRKILENAPSPAATTERSPNLNTLIPNPLYR